MWKIVGDATAEGRLLVDLTAIELSLSTPFILLEPGAPPILPDPLPSALGATRVSDEGIPLPGAAHNAREESSIERSTGFVQRSSARLDGPRFVKSLVLAWMNQADASYFRLTAFANSVGAGVSPQAVEQRFAPRPSRCFNRYHKQYDVTTVLNRKPYIIKSVITLPAQPEPAPETHVEPVEPVAPS